MRKLLYKILPDAWVPYILHTRPRAWFIVSAHMSVGFLLANGLNFGDGQIKQWLLAILAWGILGNGGTLAINSAYDLDEGDIGYLENPPPVPSHLNRFALILLLIGTPVAAYLGFRFLLAYLVCALMSLMYSIPPFLFKSRAGFDVLINSIGFGGLTIYAGWAATGRLLEAPIINVVLAFVFFFVGFYPLTQIYQMAEDAARGDYTLARALNKRNSLILAIITTLIGFFFLFSEIGARYLQLRSLGIIIALACWMLVLIPWLIKHAEVDEKYEQKGFYKALYAWAATDVAVAIAMVPFILA